MLPLLLLKVMLPLLLLHQVMATRRMIRRTKRSKLALALTYG
jgi:hypothetical protein